MELTNDILTPLKTPSGNMREFVLETFIEYGETFAALALGHPGTFKVIDGGNRLLPSPKFREQPIVRPPRKRGRSVDE